MSGAIKAVGKGLGSVAKFAAPVVSKMPGFGTVLAPLLAAGGSILSGGNLQSHIQAGLGALNPLSLPGGGGMFGDILKGMGVGSGLNTNTPFTGFNAGQAFMQGMGGGTGLPWMSGGGFQIPGFAGPTGMPTGTPWGQTGTPFGMPGVAPAAAQPGIIDQLFGALKDPKLLALLGIGGAGAGLLSKSGALDPRIVPDDRNAATSDFSSLLSGALGGDLGAILSSGMLPGWEGSFGAGTTDAQMGDITGVQDAFARFLSGDQGTGALNTLTGMSQSGGGLTLPPELMAALGLDMGGGGNEAISRLLGISTDTPERQMLLQAGSQDPTQGGQAMIGQGAGLLQSLATSPELMQLLSGGQGADINEIGRMLTEASAPGLSDNIAQLREQFSFNGLRNSTDLNQGVSNLMARNQAGISGALASIIPQLTQGANTTALGAGGLMQQLGQSLGTMGQGAGQLGLGAQGNVLSAFGTAGQLGQGGIGQLITALQGAGGLQKDQGGILASLFGGQQGNALQAALGLPGSFSQLSQLPGILGQNAFNLSQGAQNNTDTMIQRMIANSTQQQSLMPLLLQFLSSTPQQQVGDSLFSQLGSILAAGAGMKAAK